MNKSQGCRIVLTAVILLFSAVIIGDGLPTHLTSGLAQTSSYTTHAAPSIWIALFVALALAQIAFVWLLRTKTLRAMVSEAIVWVLFMMVGREVLMLKGTVCFGAVVPRNCVSGNWNLFDIQWIAMFIVFGVVIELFIWLALRLTPPSGVGFSVRRDKPLSRESLAPECE